MPACSEHSPTRQCQLFAGGSSLPEACSMSYAWSNNGTCITQYCLLSLVATSEESCHPSDAIETMVRPQRGPPAACI